MGGWVLVSLYTVKEWLSSKMIKTYALFLGEKVPYMAFVPCEKVPYMVFGSCEKVPYMAFFLVKKHQGPFGILTTTTLSCYVKEFLKNS